MKEDSMETETIKIVMWFLQWAFVALLLGGGIVNLLKLVRRPSHPGRTAQKRALAIDSVQSSCIVRRLRRE
jgi:hypothetical protein